jgi:glycosyltransferase involved in cell wall biosynthesis
MESSLLVSVVVPCYNQALYLSEALQSILEQTYTNWECIIVNDGSTDNTEIVATEWMLKDGRFKYLKKENGGLSSARNYGIKNTNGDYILTLDADDKFEKTFIEKGVKIFRQDCGIGIVSCWGYRFDNYKVYGLFKPNGKDLQDYLFNSAALASCLFRKQCWSEVDGYDEDMKKGYEDWEFFLRVSKEGWRSEIIEEPLFFYRQHITSMRTIAQNNFDLEIKNYIYFKHKDLYVENFERVIEYFLFIADKNKKNELKRINSIDFRLGKIILRPIRFIKNKLT